MNHKILRAIKRIKRIRDKLKNPKILQEEEIKLKKNKLNFLKGKWIKGLHLLYCCWELMEPKDFNKSLFHTLTDNPQCTITGIPTWELVYILSKSKKS